MGELLLVRHGETDWSRTNRHTGRTDVALTSYGEKQAASLAPLFSRRSIAGSYASPLIRARRTAELAGLPGVLEQDLIEWDNGDYEGLSTAEIRRNRPGWWLWTDGAPGGESWEQVGARCERTIGRVEPALADGDVALFGHGHSLRALTAAWVGLPAWQGGIFTQDAASLSVLGYYRGHRVVLSWNDVSAHPVDESPHPSDGSPG